MKRLLNLLVLIVMFASFVSARISIDLDVPPDFSMGETIYFNYSVISDTNQKIAYSPYIFCPKSQFPLIQEKTVDLIANQPLNEIFYFLKVTEDAEPQNCTAYVQILSPVQMTESKTFTIKTLPSISFDLSLCKDASCSQGAKVFTQSDNVFISYSSTVPASLSASLTYPDKTIKQLTLPAYFKADQLGTYTIEATATKEGFKPTKKTELFAVIEKQADIAFVGVCNADGSCSGSENYRNCPQDCASGGKDNYCDKLSDGICDPDCANGIGDYDCTMQNQTKSTVRTYILIIGALIIIITILLLIYFRQRGDRQILNQTQDLELRNFILASISKGHSREQIKNRLVSLGWKEEQLKRFFK